MIAVGTEIREAEGRAEVEGSSTGSKRIRHRRLLLNLCDDRQSSAAASTARRPPLE